MLKSKIKAHLLNTSSWSVLGSASERTKQQVETAFKYAREKKNSTGQPGRLRKNGVKDGFLMLTDRLCCHQMVVQGLVLSLKIQKNKKLSKQ